MRVIFFGSSPFAVCILKCLIDSEYEMIGAVTQPDRPKGRGRKIVAPPVKAVAEGAGIDVFQPARCKDPEFIAKICSLNPDFLVVAAYGCILPKELLKIPRQAPINVHASILPRYRGAAPVHWAIINGDKKTGVSTMVMEEGMDTGDALLIAETKIAEKETVDSLSQRLAVMGGELLIQTLDRWMAGSLVRRPQNPNKVSYAPALQKEDGHICWEESARVIEWKIRGMAPWPSAFGILSGKRIKILEVEVADQIPSASAGTVIRGDDGGFMVACGSGIISIKRLQMEGKKTVFVDDFLRGLKHPIEGEVFV